MKKLSIFLLLVLLLMSATGYYLYRNPAYILSLAPKISSSSAFTCIICGSTKYVDTKYFLGYIPKKSIEHIKYGAPGYPSCNHIWTNGIRNAYPNPVSDGHVVLVRKDGRYGAFLLHRQQTEPEKAEYDWWYQSDGSGNLDKSSRTVATGSGVTPGIQFFVFNISWSGNSEGKGWIYYQHFPGDHIKQDDLYLCVTDLTAVEGLNAADPKWKYKASPVD